MDLFVMFGQGNKRRPGLPPGGVNPGDETEPNIITIFDLLEDRRTIDVIITEFFPLCFKMAERLEKLDNIYVTGRKKRSKNVYRCRLNRYKKQREEKKKPFVLETAQIKKYSSSPSRAVPAGKTKLFSQLTLRQIYSLCQARGTRDSRVYHQVV